MALARFHRRALGQYALAFTLSTSPLVAQGSSDASTAPTQAAESFSERQDRALAAERAGRHAQAAEGFEGLVADERLPRAQRGYCARRLAVARTRLGDLDRALLAYDLAVELDPTCHVGALRDEEELEPLRASPRFGDRARALEARHALELETAAVRSAGWNAAVQRVNDQMRKASIRWLDGHLGTTSRIRMSPDGARAVTWAQDGSAWLWNAWTGEPIGLLGIFGMGGTSVSSLSGRGVRFPDVQFAAAGERVVLYESRAGWAGVWDGRSADYLGPLAEEPERLRDVTIVPGSARVGYTTESGRVCVLDVSTLDRERALVLDAPGADSLLFSQDAALLELFPRGGGCRILDAVTGRTVGEIEAGALSVLGWNHDGTRLPALDRGRRPVLYSLQDGRGSTVLPPRRIATGASATYHDWGHGDRTVQEFDALGNDDFVYLRADRLLSATDAGVTQLWDVESGRELATLAGIDLRPSWHAWCGFDHAGERLLALDSDGGALFDARDGRRIAELVGRIAPFRGDHAVFDPSGRFFATAQRFNSEEMWVRVFDLSSGRLVDELDLGRGSVFSLHFSATGRLGATSAWGWAAAWDPTSGLVPMTPHVLQIAEDGLVLGLPRWSVDGSRVLLSTWGKVSRFEERTWDLRSGASTASTAASGGGFLGGSRRFTTRPAEGVPVREVVPDGPAARAGMRVGDRVLALDGRSVVTPIEVVEAARRAGNAARLSLRRGAEEVEAVLEFPPGAPRRGRDMGFRMAHETRFTIEPGEAGVAASEFVHEWTDDGDFVRNVVASRDGSRIVVCEGKDSVLFDTASGRVLRRFPVRGLNEPAWLGALHRCVAPSPDGKLVAVAREADVLLSTDAVPPAERVLPGSAVDLAFSPDGSRLAGASPHGSVLVWDLNSSRLVFEGHGHFGAVRFVEFSPDGKTLVSVGRDSTARLWDPLDGRSSILLDGHAGLVNRPSFSMDGSRVLTIGDDAVACVWDSGSGACLARLESHVGPVLHGEFSSDGSRVLTQAQDGSTRIWSASEGRLLATRVDYDDGWVVFDPNGYFHAGGRGADRSRISVQGEHIPLSSYSSILESPERVLRSIAGERVPKPAVLPRAPKLRVAAPLDPLLPERTFRLEVLFDDPFGVESVELVQDGRVEEDAWIRKHLSTTGKTTRLSCERSIATGALQSTIVVRAKNLRGIRSAPETVYVRWSPPRRDLYVLALGVADYANDALDLAYPNKDADDLVARFAKEESHYYERVHTLVLRDAEVTTARVRRAREEFLLKAQPEDTVVVFVAGHGTRSESGEYYFLTPNSTPADPYEGIERQVLESLVTWDRLHAKRRILLLDTCHSGAAFEDGQRGRRVDVFEPQAVDAAAGTGLYILAASSERGFAQEMRGNGLFTRCLLEGLDGAADTNADGFVSIDELKTFATEEVHRRSGGRQRPTAPKVLGGEDFPVARRASVPSSRK